MVSRISAVFDPRPERMAFRRLSKFLICGDKDAETVLPPRKNGMFSAMPFLGNAIQNPIVVLLTFLDQSLKTDISANFEAASYGAAAL